MCWLWSLGDVSRLHVPYLLSPGTVFSVYANDVCTQSRDRFERRMITKQGCGPFSRLRLFSFSLFDRFLGFFTFSEVLLVATGSMIVLLIVLI